METNLREDIKNLAEGQSAIKEQRKTVHFTGERTLTPYAAFAKHQNNRHQLRLLYAVQGLQKGLTLAEIEPRNRRGKEPLNSFQIQLDRLMLKYATEQAVHNS